MSKGSIVDVDASGWCMSKSSKNKEDFGELNQSLIDKISYLNQNINNLNRGETK